MGKIRLPSLSFMTLATTTLTLWHAFGVDAAVCAGGKPTVKVIEEAETVTDCDCFAKDPAGTQIFAFRQLSISVHTPVQEFGTMFDPDSVLTCDAEHLYVTAKFGATFVKHVYPLKPTAITSGIGGEQAVLPGDHPDSHLQHLIETGQARLQRTL